MTKEGTAVGTGTSTTLVNSYEEREILIAQGVDFHVSDLRILHERLEGWATEFEAGPTGERYREIVEEALAMEFRLPAELPGQAMLNRMA